MHPSPLIQGRSSPWLVRMEPLKSILIKIICSYYEDYEREIYIEAQHLYFHSPQFSFSKSIRRLHQIIGKDVVPTTSITENLALNAYLDSAAGLRNRRQHIQTRAPVLRPSCNRSDRDASISSEFTGDWLS